MPTGPIFAEPSLAAVMVVAGILYILALLVIVVQAWRGRKRHRADS